MTRLPRKTLLLMGGLLLVGLLLLWLTHRLAATPLELTNSQPADGATNISISLNQITLVFNQPLDSNDEVQINSLPPLTFTSRIETTRNLLVLTLKQPLLPQEAYNLEVISTQTGESVGRLTFTTQALDTEGRGDPNIGQTLVQKERQDFPLLHWIPYESQDFKVDYLEPLKLEVTIKTSQEAAEAQLNAWIQSHGVDPATHEIIYRTP